MMKRQTRNAFSVALIAGGYAALAALVLGHADLITSSFGEPDRPAHTETAGRWEPFLRPRR